jgi:molybdopterin adenylyltransferase
VSERISAAVLTSSDAGYAGFRADSAGELLAAWVSDRFNLVARIVLPDDADRIEGALRGFASRGVRLTLTTGGTGLGPRDVTVEAVRRAATRVVPGVGEALRAAGIQKLPQAMLSRQVAAVIGTMVVVTLPGSPRAVVEGLQVVDPVLPHLLDLVAGRTRHAGAP